MKIKKLQRELQKENIDFAVFFGDDPNLIYFCGVVSDGLILVVPKNNSPFLLVNGFEADRIKKLTKIKIIKNNKNSLLKAILRLKPEVLRSSLEREFLNIKSHTKVRGFKPYASSYKKINVSGRIGVVFDKISYKNFRLINGFGKIVGKIIDIEHICAKLRQVKTSEEIRLTKFVCNETDKILQDCFDNLGFFKTEIDVKNFLKKRVVEKGFDVSFDPIVASGKNACFPHHVSDGSKLKGFTIIDFGLRYNNYCSDMSRTVFFGKPSRKELAVYDRVLKFQKILISKARCGCSLEDLNVFAKKEFGIFLIHNIGHSVGIEVHDLCVKPLQFQAGVIIAIEPGFYSKKFGIRVEDVILISKKDAVVLTDSSVFLKVIGKVKK